jgi:hypothetical protein
MPPLPLSLFGFFSVFSPDLFISVCSYVPISYRISLLFLFFLTSKSARALQRVIDKNRSLPSIPNFNGQ